MRLALWYANLLHAHGGSQEASLGVSDPGNKQEVAVVKMPDPGQLVCRMGGSEQGSVIEPSSPCYSPSPTPPFLSPGLQKLSAELPSQPGPPISAWSELC